VANASWSPWSVLRRDLWSGDEWDEVLGMEPTHIRLGILNTAGHLLDSHDYHGGLDAILGDVVPGSARIAGGHLRAKFKLSRSRQGERLAADLADGMRFKLIAGYRTRAETIDQTTNPETRTATDWEPHEVSIVAVAAEGASTGLRAA